MAEIKHGGIRYKIPLEKREQCLALIREGIFSYREVAQQLGVSHVAVWKWIQQAGKFDVKDARNQYVNDAWAGYFPEGN